MSAPGVSEATIEVLRFVSEHQSPPPTEYQLNRHMMNAHGPEAFGEVYRELTKLGLAEARADAEGWRRWHLTAEGERRLLEATRT